VPRVERSTWALHLRGLCETPYTLVWDGLLELPQVDVRCDLHCVTRWSRLDNVFTGVPLRVIVDLARPRSDARFAVLHATSAPDDDWTTNVPLDDLVAADAVLAHAHDGRPLSPEHGGPVRVVIPRLYLWKSAKWIRAIELVDDDVAGFWEMNGYHLRGDPWREERFGW
jgi:DMSO/TMAO reductase YedYZ molybdopterin-dependent catalytic subunit